MKLFYRLLAWGALSLLVVHCSSGGGGPKKGGGGGPKGGPQGGPPPGGGGPKGAGGPPGRGPVADDVLKDLRGRGDVEAAPSGNPGDLIDDGEDGQFRDEALSQGTPGGGNGGFVGIPLPPGSIQNDPNLESLDEAGQGSGRVGAPIGKSPFGNSASGLSSDELQGLGGAPGLPQVSGGGAESSTGAPAGVTPTHKVVPVRRPAARPSTTKKK